MKKHLLLIVFSFFIWTGCSDSTTNSKESGEITIGALVPLSGEYKNQGDEILAALNFAVADINEQFSDDDKNVQIKLEYLDTKTDSATAKIQLQKLLSQNIRIIIGPLTSVEVLGVKNIIDTSGSIIISPSSTLTSLAMNDNIYRIVPNDSKMIEATVDVMWNEGIRNLALFHVDNDWGKSFISELQEKFEAKGGIFLGSASYIGARQSELLEYLADLRTILNSSDDLSSTALQMISLDVGSFLLELASEDTIFEKVRWYGCDGLVNTDELFVFEKGSEFAVKVGFTSPIFGYVETSATENLTNRIKTGTGSSPDTYSLLSYDALSIAANVLAEVGENSELSKIKSTLSSISKDHEGLTGNIEFNEAGDRSNGVYNFWQVVEENDDYIWKLVKTYNNGLIE